jgi:Sec-independent protein translocase protein TatA
MNSFLLLDGVSGGELIFVFMFILLFFGSKSIPKISRNLGRGMRYVKDATQEIQNDIRNSANEVSDEIDVKDQELTKNNGKDIE